MPVEWPSTLPKPIIEGYSLTHGDGREVTEMEQGPRRIRNRFINVPKQFTLPFKMNREQLAIFGDFWNDQINHGVDPFDMKLRIDGQIAARTIHIIERGPEVPIGGGFYLVSLQVETV